MWFFCHEHLYSPMTPLRPHRAATLALPALLLFASLALAVQTKTAAAIDLAISHWMEHHGQPWLTRLLFWVTDAHQPIGILLLGAVLLAWLWRRGERRWCALVIAAVPGGMLLNVLLKWTFQRARPEFGEPLVHLLTYSFPSGHTLGATVFYGVLAVYLRQHARNPTARAALAVAALGMVLLVALSRLYLGAHYPTDVLAGMAEGCAWLTICMTVISNWRSPRPAGAPSKSS
ncbi:phosphatase PAP2 family protein [Massilia arenosa]|uniref:Phosphatase PAP2 family protein n=2 Tax=Zemynaea arenosa TaxID=2561931 RepID=A0A4Y9SN10_9BURK|nr:phosphatase PAP2 family protein [Massilia arenosa]